MTLTSRAIYNDQLTFALEKLTKLFGYEKCLLTNIKSESFEGAIKIARRWAYEKKGVQNSQAEILFTKNHFLGKTLTLSAASTNLGIN